MDDYTIGLADLRHSEDGTNGEDRDGVVRVSLGESEEAFHKTAKELEEESVVFLEKMTPDLDKAAKGEPFDLKAYFQGTTPLITLFAQSPDSNIKRSMNGGKPKRMGVGVKNLTVVGVAPETSVISTNLTPILKITNLFRPSYWYTFLFFAHDSFHLSGLKKHQPLNSCPMYPRFVKTVGSHHLLLHLQVEKKTWKACLFRWLVGFVFCCWGWLVGSGLI